MRNLFVGDKAEELGDAVEACTLFVIGATMYQGAVSVSVISNI
jgi:hypothetical protein